MFPWRDSSIQTKSEVNHDTIDYLTAFTEQFNFCSGVDFIAVRNFSRKLFSIWLPVAVLACVSLVLVYMCVMQLKYFQT